MGPREIRGSKRLFKIVQLFAERPRARRRHGALDGGTRAPERRALHLNGEDGVEEMVRIGFYKTQPQRRRLPHQRHRRRKAQARHAYAVDGDEGGSDARRRAVAAEIGSDAVDDAGAVRGSEGRELDAHVAGKRHLVDGARRALLEERGARVAVEAAALLRRLRGQARLEEVRGRPRPRGVTEALALARVERAQRRLAQLRRARIGGVARLVVDLHDNVDARRRHGRDKGCEMSRVRGAFAQRHLAAK
mmetsp:Transcript_11941/g.39862  ORF Transcript_11941/g.39862 Transcript_11941/m.39862 type:complete len:248 (-) Transcript_11941:174-917(-)